MPRRKYTRRAASKRKHRPSTRAEVEDDVDVSEDDAGGEDDDDEDEQQDQNPPPNKKKKKPRAGAHEDHDDNDNDNDADELMPDAVDQDNDDDGQQDANSKHSNENDDDDDDDDEDEKNTKHDNQSDETKIQTKQKQKRKENQPINNNNQQDEPLPDQGDDDDEEEEEEKENEEENKIPNCKTTKQDEADQADAYLLSFAWRRSDTDKLDATAATTAHKTFDSTAVRVAFPARARQRKSKSKRRRPLPYRGKAKIRRASYTARSYLQQQQPANLTIADAASTTTTTTTNTNANSHRSIQTTTTTTTHSNAAYLSPAFSGTLEERMKEYSTFSTQFNGLHIGVRSGAPTMSLDDALADTTTQQHQQLDHHDHHRDPEFIKSNDILEVPYAPALDNGGGASSKYLVYGSEFTHDLAADNMKYLMTPSNSNTEKLISRIVKDSPPQQQCGLADEGSPFEENTKPSAILKLYNKYFTIEQSEWPKHTSPPNIPYNEASKKFLQSITQGQLEPEVINELLVENKLHYHKGGVAVDIYDKREEELRGLLKKATEHRDMNLKKYFGLSVDDHALLDDPISKSNPAEESDYASDIFRLLLQPDTNLLYKDVAKYVSQSKVVLPKEAKYNIIKKILLYTSKKICVDPSPLVSRISNYYVSKENFLHKRRKSKKSRSGDSFPINAIFTRQTILNTRKRTNKHTVLNYICIENWKIKPKKNISIQIRNPKHITVEAFPDNTKNQNLLRKLNPLEQIKNMEKQSHSRTLPKSRLMVFRGGTQNKHICKVEIGPTPSGKYEAYHLYDSDQALKKCSLPSKHAAEVYTKVFRDVYSKESRADLVFDREIIPQFMQVKQGNYNTKPTAQNGSNQRQNSARSSNVRTTAGSARYPSRNAIHAQGYSQPNQRLASRLQGNATSNIISQGNINNNGGSVMNRSVNFRRRNNYNLGANSQPNQAQNITSQSLSSSSNALQALSSMTQPQQVPHGSGMSIQLTRNRGGIGPTGNTRVTINPGNSLLPNNYQRNMRNVVYNINPQRAQSQYKLAQQSQQSQQNQQNQQPSQKQQQQPPQNQQRG